LRFCKPKQSKRDQKLHQVETSSREPIICPFGGISISSSMEIHSIQDEYRDLFKAMDATDELIESLAQSKSVQGKQPVSLPPAEIPLSTKWKTRAKELRKNQQNLVDYEVRNYQALIDNRLSAQTIKSPCFFALIATVFGFLGFILCVLLAYNLSFRLFSGDSLVAL